MTPKAVHAFTRLFFFRDVDARGMPERATVRPRRAPAPRVVTVLRPRRGSRWLLGEGAARARNGWDPVWQRRWPVDRPIAAPFYKVATDGTVHDDSRFLPDTTTARIQSRGWCSGGDGHLYGTTPAGAGQRRPGDDLLRDPRGASLTTPAWVSALRTTTTIMRTAPIRRPRSRSARAGVSTARRTSGVRMGNGTVVQKSPPAGEFTTLYSFFGSSPTDFYAPSSALTLGADGNFYGHGQWRRESTWGDLPDHAGGGGPASSTIFAGGGGGQLARHADPGQRWQLLRAHPGGSHRTTATAFQNGGPMAR